MIDIIFYWLIIFVTLTGPGLLVLLLGINRSHITELQFYLLAPAAGLVVAIPCSFTASFLGVRPSLVLMIMAFIAWFALVDNTFLFRDGRGLRANKLFLSLLIFIIANFLTGLDILKTGVHEYFPLTNDDTFSYVGLIDQIRSVAKTAPTMGYANGLSPFIEHATISRGAVSAYAAGFADILNLRSYEIFFLLLRTGAAINITLLLALALVLEVKPKWAALALIITLSGNYFLHQVLQQFLSSLMGSILAAFCLVVTVFLSREPAKRTYVFIGASVGAAFVASPEAGIFYLVCFGSIVCANCLLLSGRGTLPVAILSCLTGFCISTNLLLFGTLSAIVSQARQYSGGHPGDWFATFSSLIQFSGVDLIAVFPPAEISWLMGAACVAVCLGVVVFSGWCIGQLRRTILLEDHRDQELLPLLIYVLYGLCVLAVTAATHRGYAYLKLMEYFNFVVPVSLLGLALLLSKITHPLKGGGWSLALMIVACVSVESIAGRERLYSIYSQSIKLRGPVAAFTASVPLSCGKHLTIIPDYSSMPLEMAAYMNTAIPSQFDLYPANSVRFRMIGSRGFPDLALMGFSEQTADINRPDLITSDPTARLAKIDGYINVGSSGSGWLPPEGYPALLRWMGSQATFDAFFVEKHDNLSLHFYVHDAGPDVKSLEGVEVIFGDTVLAKFDGASFLGEHSIRLPEQDGPKIVHAEFRVTGASTGSRHFRIGQLYFADAVTGDKLPNFLKTCQP